MRIKKSVGLSVTKKYSLKDSNLTPFLAASYGQD